MLKDIKFKKVNNVALAMVPESKKEEDTIWYSYIINLKKKSIFNILINSKGYGKINDEQRKTSTLRYFIEELKPDEFKRFEPIDPNLLHMAHEFWISFQENKKMLDKKYIFLSETLNEDNMVEIPSIDKKGVLII